MLSNRGAGWAKTVGRTTVRAGAMATTALRELPDAVIIGVKRGGTTSLFRDLERHPAMCPLVPSAERLPLAENMKGVHYFDTNAHRSPTWYRSHFPTRWTLGRHRKRVGAAFTAEASPYYFFHPLGARRAVVGLRDDTVFVVLLRDPVERTVSHWAEQTRNGVETLDLPEALAAEDARTADATDRLTRGVDTVIHAHEQQSYAAQSMYADSLQRWFDLAGRDRVLVLFSEDYYRDAQSTLAAITNRLGVPGHAEPTPLHRNAAPRPGVLDPQVDATLTVKFRPDVERVADMLGVEPPWPRFRSPDADISSPIASRL